MFEKLFQFEKLRWRGLNCEQIGIELKNMMVLVITVIYRNILVITDDDRRIRI